MEDFERKHVHQFYQDSSKEFSATRYKPWPKIEYFYQKYVKETDIILDAGSGNGRNTLFPERTVSLDFSDGLLRIAQEKHDGMAYIRADLGDDLGIVPGVFDICISVAVIHHLSSEERRYKAVQSMVNSLRIGGHALIYVWSESPESKPSKFISIPNLEDASLDKISGLSGNDVFVGWKSKNTLNRYYHLFKMNELENLLSTLPVEILESGKDHGNYYAVIRRVI
ncbi:tRNA (uracil-5-)-methyltransferase TRM9 [Nematocida ausubeli]|nr:tRNA (uracil-5-)-methyltransferase TRM9 [Nematocida ausubeli]KAI5135500.1 tRNA (uracil-5-)-methyltransferase TRM9 [Nematocida ausubeli]KAI5162307.1 tRNA (uracil-5-)-methyltransferase TRM9 [Nematocida ausubeli]